MASTKDLKAKFEKDAAKAGAAPAPDSAAGKKALFEQAIKDASPKDPKPKVRRYGSSWGGHTCPLDGAYASRRRAGLPTRARPIPSRVRTPSTRCAPTASSPALTLQATTKFDQPPPEKKSLSDLP